MPRRPRQKQDDAPATVPAVVNPRREDWAEWSADREQRRIESEITERRAITDGAIYPREIAEKIAQDAARTVVPDWTVLRDDHRGLFVKLLRDRPELQQREVRQLDSLLHLIRDNLPSHLQPLITDLRTILEIRLLAHEAAAFLVGVETGRRLERQYVDSRGRLRTRRESADVETDSPFRLHLGEPKPRE